MGDLLRIDHINSLQQPLQVREYGSDTWWELHDICVETGLLRFLVGGLLQRSHISEIAAFKGMDGIEHDPDTFYTDWGDTLDD